MGYLSYRVDQFEEGDSMEKGHLTQHCSLQKAAKGLISLLVNRAWSGFRAVALTLACIGIIRWTC